MQEQENIVLRQMLPTDGAAINLLAQESPDTGALAFYTKYHYDMYETLSALHPNMIGVVAQVPHVSGTSEVSGHESLVGMGLLTFGECRYEGELYPFAYLSLLSVHPDYRRRGIASRLALWRVEAARERFKELGKEGIIVAGVQAGNTGSLLAAQKWCKQRLDGRSQVGVSKIRGKPPKALSGIQVRPAQPDEYKEIAEKQDHFYRDYNLYPPQSADGLKEWLSEAAFGHSIHEYFVAVDTKVDNEGGSGSDARGHILAGFGVTEYGRLVTDHVAHLPTPLRIANVFLKMVPADGVTKRLRVDRFWFGREHLGAGQYLWESARWLLRERGTMLMTIFDRRSPLREVIALPKFMPRKGGSVVLSAPVAAREDKALYFNQ